MKILVTGATGFVGRELLPLLAEEGHEVSVLTRDPLLAGVRLPIHCAIHSWDPGSEDPPPEAFDGVEAVVHLAGENVAGGRWTVKRKEAIVQSRVESTRRLVSAMQKLDAPPHTFVSAAAIGIYGDGGEEILSEDSSISVVNDGFLGGLCRDWERETFRAEEFGLRAVALRIGVVLGKDGGAMKMMLPAFRLGLGGRLGGGNQWMSWIHVRDLAGIVHHVLQTPSMRGPINAVAPHPETNRNFAKIFARELGRPALFPVPAFVLRTALGEMSQMLLASQRISAQKLLDGGYKFLYPRLTLALRQVCNHFDHLLLMEQWTPQPVEKIFEFFSNADNLKTLTPDFLGFKVLSQSTDKLEKGTRLDYRIGLHGIPVRWQTLILEFKDGEMFRDTQTKGPYALWFHTHEFIPSNGGTVIRDKVYYRLPVDYFTDPVAHPFVRKDLEKIFMYRRAKVEELFAGEGAGTHMSG